MPIFYCVKCADKASSVVALTSLTYTCHPSKGKHILYEAREKSKYTCKYCGYQASSIMNLISLTCQSHPDGSFKGHHLPAL